MAITTNSSISVNPDRRRDGSWDWDMSGTPAERKRPDQGIPNRKKLAAGRTNKPGELPEKN
jgi:hypothetical protein